MSKILDGQKKLPRYHLTASTWGGAIDAALRRHHELFPESEVFRASLSESSVRPGWLAVVLDASNGHCLYDVEEK